MVQIEQLLFNLVRKKGVGSHSSSKAETLRRAYSPRQFQLTRHAPVKPSLSFYHHSPYSFPSEEITQFSALCANLSPVLGIHCPAWVLQPPLQAWKSL